MAGRNFAYLASNITGIPALSETQYEDWHLLWKPWPGQSVHIQLTRLPAIIGSTLTIEQVNVLTRSQTEAVKLICKHYYAVLWVDNIPLVLPQMLYS